MSLTGDTLGKADLLILTCEPAFDIRFGQERPYAWQ
jgi:hypothetical protein